eukprot:Seg670.4 transcript_id=Seg670.4/GoldUCD/mRNA.D3Y31 product="hypothetical protein" protein_id=Seg670.4/GoldUCD/D3Y31
MGYDCFTNEDGVPKQQSFEQHMGIQLDIVENEEDPTRERLESQDKGVVFSDILKSHCAEEVGKKGDSDESSDDDDDDNDFPIEIKRRRLDVDPRNIFISFRGTREDCVIIMYEEEFSQSRIDGRDGSNACSFIAVIFVHLFLKERMTLLEETPVFNGMIFDEILHEAMVRGNHLYDKYRRRLPHRYCSIHDVADQMAEVSPFTVKEERPVSVQNEHQMSTLEGQLEFLMVFKNASL